MPTRIDVLEQAKSIQETYGEGTLAANFAKDVEDYLHSLQLGANGQVKEHISPASSLELEQEEGFVWKK